MTWHDITLRYVTLHHVHYRHCNTLGYIHYLHTLHTLHTYFHRIHTLQTHITYIQYYNTLHTYNTYITSHYMTWHDIALQNKKYITLQEIKKHYITLQNTTLDNITLHNITLHNITLHNVTLRPGAVMCVARNVQMAYHTWSFNMLKQLRRASVLRFPISQTTNPKPWTPKHPKA